MTELERLKGEVLFLLEKTEPENKLYIQNILYMIEDAMEACHA